MGQQRDPSSESPPSEAVDEAVGEADDDRGDFTERYFWVLLGAMVLLATGAGVGVVYTQYERIDRTVKSAPYVDRVAQVAEAVPYVGGGADTTEAEGKGAPSFGSFTEMKRLVVNPAGSEGTRYLAVSIAFEAKSSGVAKELKNKKVVVRDAMLRLLSKRTAENLSDPTRRDDLKEALRKETNSILQNGTVNRLYFTEFVLQ